MLPGPRRYWREDCTMNLRPKITHNTNLFRPSIRRVCALRDPAVESDGTRKRISLPSDIRDMSALEVSSLHRIALYMGRR